MNTHELLEMASLDALGLLDAEEREAFERAFRAAAPSVQAQIRREQLRFCQIEDTLPVIDPPLGLRARVLNAVREAMGGASSRRAAAPALTTPTGVSRFWRIGAVGALAAALVLGVSTLQVLNETRGLTDAQDALARSEQFQQQYGERFQQQFFGSATRFVSFQAGDNSTAARSAKARLMLDPATKRAELYVKDLPAEGEYEVIVYDAQGNEVPMGAKVTFFAREAGIRTASIPAIDVDKAKQMVIRLQGATKPLLSGNL